MFMQHHIRESTPLCSRVRLSMHNGELKSAGISIFNIYWERCFLRRVRGLFSQWLSTGFVFLRAFENLLKVFISLLLSSLFHLLTLTLY